MYCCVSLGLSLHLALALLFGVPESSCACLFFSTFACVYIGAYLWAYLGKKTRRTKEEVEREHEGMDRPRYQPAQEGSEEPMETVGYVLVPQWPSQLSV